MSVPHRSIVKFVVVVVKADFAIRAVVVVVQFDVEVEILFHIKYFIKISKFKL